MSFCERQGLAVKGYCAQENYSCGKKKTAFSSWQVLGKPKPGSLRRENVRSLGKGGRDEGSSGKGSTEENQGYSIRLGFGSVVEYLLGIYKTLGSTLALQFEEDRKAIEHSDLAF